MEYDKRRRKNQKKKNKQNMNVENGVGETANLVSNGKDEHTNLSVTANEQSSNVDSNGVVGETSTMGQNLVNNGKDEPSRLSRVTDDQSMNVDQNGAVEARNSDPNLVISGKNENIPPEFADGQRVNMDSNGHLPNGKECATSEETIQKLKEENDILIQKETLSKETIRKLKAENDMHVQKEVLMEETIRKLTEQNDMHMQKEIASEETILKLKEKHEMHVQNEAISEDTIRKLKEENDMHMQKEVTLEEIISNLRTDNELQTQKQVGLETRIAQLQSENNSLLQKEAALVEKTNQLLNEKAVLSQKGESLEQKIYLLESDLSSFVEKEVSFPSPSILFGGSNAHHTALCAPQNSTKETISNLNGNIAVLQAQVAELEESRNKVMLENQQLREKVSSIQSTVQNLGNSNTSSCSRNASEKDLASENEDLKSQIEAAFTLVEKLMAENAELVEKVTELCVSVDLQSAEIGHSEVTGVDGTTEFAKSTGIAIPIPESADGMTELVKPTGVAIPVPESAESASVSSQELNSFEDILARENGNYIGTKHVVGLISRSSLVSDDAGEIVQIPLDDNEVEDMESQDAKNVEIDPVPITDAPLIGAPFRFISFVANYVSGADLVDQSSSNTGR
ncbi:hypothetical protein Fmac_018088 [Flemingia macrophylla]|uniref:Uncharacterized protein n=1 Tax=Flemingia macrophylla TaxID=520843 RepID=A0ABD1M3Y8_9FABA